MFQRLALPSLESWQRTLVILFTAQMLSAAGFALIFPFLPLYVQSLGSSTGIAIEFWIGMVFSAQAITMAIASPIWGALADRHGRKLMVERATFGGAIILLLMGFAQSAEQLALLRAIQGLVTGIISAASALLAAVTPRQRMGYAMGVLQVGLWAGLAVGPILGGIMADTWGFRMPFIFTSVALALAGVMVWWGVEEKFEAPPRSAGPRAGFLQDWRHIFATPGISQTYGIRFTSLLSQQMIAPIAPLFIQSLLEDTARLGTLTGLVAAGSSVASTISAIYLGRLGDRIGHRRVLFVAALVAGLCYAPQGLVTSVWQLLALQILTGAAIGGIIPSLSALLTGYSQPGQEGAIFGLDNSVTAAARAAAPLVSAFVAYWIGIKTTFVVAGGALLIGAVLARVALPDPGLTSNDE